MKSHTPKHILKLTTSIINSSKWCYLRASIASIEALYFGLPYIIEIDEINRDREAIAAISCILTWYKTKAITIIPPPSIEQTSFMCLFAFLSIGLFGCSAGAFRMMIAVAIKLNATRIIIPRPLRRISMKLVTKAQEYF